MTETVTPIPQGPFVDVNGNLTVEGRALLRNFERILRDLQTRIATLETP